MQHIDLSSLSVAELRRLLDSARSRGEATLSYRILQEMEARRVGGRSGTFQRRALADPPGEAADLDHAAEADDDLPSASVWRPQATAAVSPQIAEPPPGAEAHPVATELDRAAEFGAPPAATERSAASEADAGLRLHPVEIRKPATAARRRSGRLGALVAGLVAGVAGGVAIGWWVWAPAPSGPSFALAGSSGQPPPLALTAAVQGPPAAPSPHDAGPEARTPGSPEEAAEAPERMTTEPEPQADVPDNDVASTSTPPAPDCAAAATPADRVICADPQLRDLQQTLRDAYSAALEAHEDRDLLRQRQLAWASGRDTVTDPRRLATLYGARIRKLEAATEQARAARPQ